MYFSFLSSSSSSLIDLVISTFFIFSSFLYLSLSNASAFLFVPSEISLSKFIAPRSKDDLLSCLIKLSLIAKLYKLAYLLKILLYILKDPSPFISIFLVYSIICFSCSSYYNFQFFFITFYTSFCSKFYFLISFSIKHLSSLANYFLSLRISCYSLSSF